MNIVYHEGKPYVTDKETFPTKPERLPLSCDEDCEGKCGDICPVIGGNREGNEINEKWYNQSVADFIRDCTPIVSEDQEKVRTAIIESIGRELNNLLPESSKVFKLQLPYPLLDHTIYKVEGLKFELTCKWNGNRDACGNETCWDVYPSEGCQKSPRAFKVVETKTINGVINGILKSNPL
jgi:hypothetical protein